MLPNGEKPYDNLSNNVSRISSAMFSQLQQLPYGIPSPPPKFRQPDPEGHEDFAFPTGTGAIMCGHG